MSMPLNGLPLNGRHETVLQRIKNILGRAFSLCSQANGNGPIETLLIIRSDVEEMTRIFKQHDDLFLEPRITLYSFKWKTEAPDSIVEDPPMALERDDKQGRNATEVRKCDPEPVVKIEQGACSPEPVLNRVSFEAENGSQNWSSDEDTEDVLTSQTDEMARGCKTLTSESAGDIDEQQEPKKRTSKNHCYHCKKRFVAKYASDEQKKAERTKHMIRYHPDRVFLCDCGTHIIDEADIKHHLADHPDGTVNKLLNKPPCSTCGITFVTPCGRLTKSLRHFWVDLGDVEFIEKHIKSCIFKHKKMMVCPKCPEKFPRKLSLRHFTENHWEHLIQCHCGLWVEQYKMSEHTRHKHTLPERRKKEEERRKNLKCEFFCNHCDENVTIPFVDQENDARKTHMLDSHSNKISKCECGAYIWSETEKEGHRKEHPLKTQRQLKDLIGSPTCPTCGLKFHDDEGYLTKHLKYFLFQKCDDDFVRLHLAQCSETFTRRQPKKCVYCEAEVRRFLLLGHLTENHMHLMKKCDVCQFWIHKKRFSAHRSDKHGLFNWKKKGERKKELGPEKLETLVCSDCGLTFHSKKALKYHEIKHEKQAWAKKLVQCQFCGEAIRNKDLSQHEMGHIREGVLHDCHFCGKQLPYKTYIRHVAMHKKIIAEGGRPRKRCSICFKSYTDVKKHMERMHETRERFSCKQCGKTFAEQRILLRHETLHSKSFPFNCEKCGKGYNVKCALEYHVDTVHTKVKRYICKVPSCGQSFFVNLYLRRHMKRAHPELASSTK